MSITKQDVWRAANEIDAAGDKPTAVEVRKRLGTGSYTTITAALKEWVRPGDQDDDVELEPMPAEFEDRITQAGADLFAIAMRIAQEQFQSERDAWAAERTALEAERDEAIRLADAVSAELDVMRDQLTDLRDENANVVRERAEALAVAGERARTAQEARAEAEQARGTAEQLKGRVEALEAVIATFAPTQAAPAKGKKAAAAATGDATAHLVAGSVTTEKGD